MQVLLVSGPIVFWEPFSRRSQVKPQFLKVDVGLGFCVCRTSPLELLFNIIYIYKPKDLEEQYCQYGPAGRTVAVMWMPKPSKAARGSGLPGEEDAPLAGPSVNDSILFFAFHVGQQCHIIWRPEEEAMIPTTGGCLQTEVGWAVVLLRSGSTGLGEPHVFQDLSYQPKPQNLKAS